jgi:hypothetical protein
MPNGTKVSPVGEIRAGPGVARELRKLAVRAGVHRLFRLRAVSVA